MRVLGVLVLFFLVGCSAMQRSGEAQDARTRLVGMTKVQIFACMGIPKKKATEGELEIWSYRSTNGHVSRFKSTGSGGHSGSGGFSEAMGLSDETDEKRFCDVQVVMSEGRVMAVNYNGPTGGFLTEDEQCAYAVRNCLGR